MWGALVAVLLPAVAMAAPDPTAMAGFRGGHGSSAQSSPQTRWLFAEGAQGFFETYVLVANVNAAPAHVTVTFLVEGGNPVMNQFVVGPTSRYTLATAAISSLANRAFSIVVDSDLPVLAERAMYFGHDGWDGGHVAAGVAGAATSWFHAEGATGDYFDTYILIANPNADAATVTFTYLLESGAAVTKVHGVAPTSRLTVNVETEDPVLRNAAVSTLVTSDLPIVSERAMYWPGTFQGWGDAHASFGVTGSHVSWGLAEGRAGTSAKFETYILIANPGSAPASVSIRFLREDGVEVPTQMVVPAHSRFSVEVSGKAFPSLADSNFGAIVTSTNGAPIVVERSMYWSIPGQHWAGGTNSAGTPLE